MLELGLSINALCFGIVILGCVVDAPQWLERKPLRLVGMWSYGIYVYHLAFVHFAHLVPWLHSGFARFVIENACAIAFAAASYYAFEKPLLRHKDRFVPLWKNQPQARALAVNA